MTHLLTLVGSARSRSYNLHLALAATDLAPDRVRLSIETVGGVPLYDGDVEQASGVPGRVKALKGRVVEADGLLIATPEYNRSIPGPLKNAIDWMSRPPADIPRVFGGKPVALMGVTPGSAGTRLAQQALLPVLQALGAQVWFGGTLYLSRAGDLFDDELRLTDEMARERLREHLEGFARFVRLVAPAAR